MSFSNLTKVALRLRKKAVKQGIPNWALMRGDILIDKALYFRMLAKVDCYEKRYDRACTYAIGACAHFEAFIYPERLNRHPLKFFESRAK